MKNHHHSVLFVSLLATAAAAQTPSSLLFVPKKAEFTRHASGSLAVRALTNTSVAIVQPGGSNCNQTAHKYVPGVAYQTLIGDEDNDGDVFTKGLLGSIQAMFVKRYEWDATQTKFIPRTSAVTARDVFITPSVAVGTHVSGAPGLRPCDSGRIIADGQIEYFIRGEQIIDALGMVDAQERPLKPADVRLDAIAVGEGGTVYLSFEDTHYMRLLCGTVQQYTVGDGAIVQIPSRALTFGLTGNVATARPNSGLIALSETTIDQMVKRARSQDHNGNCVTRCIDVDGLAIDPRGGYIQSGWCNFVFPVPNLLFSTESGTGGSVLSTMNYGEIAVMNGCPLASPCSRTTPTSGQQIGLRGTGSVGSLDAISSLVSPPSRFMLATTDVQTLDKNCEWAISTSMDVNSVLLYAGNGALPVSPAWDILTRLGLTTGCFPEVFPNAFYYGPFTVPMVPDGWGGKVGKLNITVPSSLAPEGMITQVFAFYAGKWQASNPMTFVK